MPNIKKGHEEHRKAVCAICWCESGQKASRCVSAAQEAALREFVVSSYSLADPRFPTGLCKSCMFILGDWNSGVENPRPLPVASRYDAVLPILTRSSPECSCTMCKIGRMNGLEWKRFSFSKHQEINPPISKNTGERLCAICFSRIYRGSNHSPEACKSSRVVVENLSGVQSSTLDKVVHGHLNSSINETGDRTMEITSIVGGQPMQVTVGKIPKVVEVPTLTCDEILTIQYEANLSDK